MTPVQSQQDGEGGKSDQQPALSVRSQQESGEWDQECAPPAHSHQEEEMRPLDV